jgi:hypothetical protein
MQEKYIENIENDVRVPGRVQLINLSKIYNWKIDDLLEVV